ncbi:unnamed protein product, partial [Phaeothamnion confervicola]
MSHRPRILLCISGSVATVKGPRLAMMLREFAEVRLIKTQTSCHFLSRAKDYDAKAAAAFKAAAPPIEEFGDEEEWTVWNAIGDDVLHIVLRDWADLMLIAPLSANTLGKMANGLCDNLLTCVARA